MILNFPESNPQTFVPFYFRICNFGDGLIVNLNEMFCYC